MQQRKMAQEVKKQQESTATMPIDHPRPLDSIELRILSQVSFTDYLWIPLITFGFLFNI